MKSSIHILIYKNTREIKRLFDNRDKSFQKRETSKHAYQEWLKACSEIHKNYNKLVFYFTDENKDSNTEETYIGEQGFYQLFKQNHPYALEFAVCFIEIRPYYYRSGYMYQKLIRKLKNKPLTNDQRIRYQKVKTAYDDYMKNKDSRLRKRYKSNYQNYFN